MAHAAIIAALFTVITTVHAADIPATGIGYRGDGSSIFPNAKPPTKWDDTTNIRWKIPLNNWTYCSPVPVGDRVYITCEPSPEHPFPRLICYASKDGKELWQQEINVLDAHPQVDTSTRTQVRNDLSDIYHRIATIYAATAPLIGTPSLKADHPTIVQINERLANVNATLLKHDKVHLPMRFVNMLDKDQWKERLEAIAKTYGYPVLPTWYRCGHAQIGHAFQTPVANADAVFVLIRGCVVAFSHEGKRLWSFDLPKGGMESISSPRLYNDKLLVQYYDELICLDQRSGKVHYRVDAPTVKAPLGDEKMGWKKYRTNASLMVFRIDNTPVVLTNRGRIVRIADGKLFSDGLPNIFLTAAIDEETGRIWSQTTSDKGGIGWRARLSLKGDTLVVDQVKIGEKKGTFKPGTQVVFYKDRLISNKFQRDPEHGNVFGHEADYRIQEKGRKTTPRTAPQSWHLTLIANGHVYALRNLGGKYAQNVTGKHVDAGVCEVYTTDGKHVATNFLNAGPWNAEQEKRLHRTGFKKMFSYSCGFNFGPDCIYIVSQDYLFCIGK